MVGSWRITFLFNIAFYLEMSLDIYHPKIVFHKNLMGLKMIKLIQLKLMFNKVTSNGLTKIST